MQSAILDGAGVRAQITATWKEPEAGSPYFGWLDIAGDPNCVKFSSIVALIRDARTGKFAVVLENTQVATTISDTDAFRLLRKMGWKSPEAVIR